VTEIACLVDFGVSTEAVLEHLRYLDELRRRVMGRPAGREDSLPVLIARHGVTHMHCTPALAATLAGSEAGRAALGRMRTLVVSSTGLTPELADALRSVVGSEAGGAPGTRVGRVLNMFGVGETTVWSTTHELTDSSEPVPIGRPLANVLCYVLDAERSPVPVGTTGELYIGGAGVARGYLHRTELTAERFVANPFATPGRDDAGDGGRLHRTGHLVRWRADGVLEHMGRTDDAHAQSSDARPRPELPADDLEASMCEVWREVLGLGEVGATDDFFALGGHSLLALRVHNRLRESLQLRVSLVDLFRHPTVRSLARAVRGAESPGPQLPGGILPLTRDASRVR
jgi:acyl-CoA synthetase (AMP-forming)/AMP-acid ligase II